MIYEEMSKAYAYDAKRLWVVNVTGLKAHEISMEFFLTLGWNVNNWTPGNIASFVTAEAARDFGPANAADIADIVMQTYQLNIARRPEFMDKALFNSVNYGDEAQQRLDAFNALLTRATTISNALPAAQQDGFFEMVLYPLRASYYQNQKYIAATKADLYAQQGRTASVTKYRNLASTAFSTIASDLTKYTDRDPKWKMAKRVEPVQHDGRAAGHRRAAVDGLGARGLGAAPGRRLGGADHRQREPAADVLVVYAGQAVHRHLHQGERRILLDGDAERRLDQAVCGVGNDHRRSAGLGQHRLGVGPQRIQHGNGDRQLPAAPPRR